MPSTAATRQHRFFSRAAISSRCSKGMVLVTACGAQGLHWNLTVRDAPKGSGGSLSTSHERGVWKRVFFKCKNEDFFVKNNQNHICLTLASHLLYNCITFALRLHHSCLSCASYLPYICIIFALHLQNICITFASQWPYMCIIFALNLHHICFIFALYLLTLASYLHYIAWPGGKGGAIEYGQPLSGLSRVGALGRNLKPAESRY
jgi:hypothetical protein